MTDMRSDGSSPPLGGYDRKLAIIVCYRDRLEHLKIFLPYMLKYFARDKLDKYISYSIHIVEQAGNQRFNAGKLRNCGFALTRDQADYFCFHDVDYLPIWADYSYCRRPARLIWHGLSLKENYDTFLGAVMLFNKEDYLKVNGFSNGYWGWGFEDTEMTVRCNITGLDFEKRDGTYQGLPHPHRGFERDGKTYTDDASKNRERFVSRFPTLKETFRQDGIADLRFRVLENRSVLVDGAAAENIFYHVVEI
jgi:hypothetical protein